MYNVTNNNFIGMISFNCACGVFMGFKSAILIDYNGYKNAFIDPEIRELFFPTYLPFIYDDNSHSADATQREPCPVQLLNGSFVFVGRCHSV